MRLRGFGPRAKRLRQDGGEGGLHELAPGEHVERSSAPTGRSERETLGNAYGGAEARRPMTMRQLTDRERVERFMGALGTAVKGPGRVYFTGGVSAVLFGWRGTTVDIDLAGEPEPAGFFEAIAPLKVQLDVNLELARPSDFIPELPGWRERSPFIARHGPVDFYHYDFYSQALAKIERDHERDRTDVRMMLEHALIKPSRLLELFKSIEPLLPRYPAIDIAPFAQRVRTVAVTP